MKAVILVGGEGTRLRPLTCNTPKPMLPLVNRPLLEHVIRYLARFGIDDVILGMCYRPDVIKNYFGGGEGFGARIRYEVEAVPLGTAGGVKNVAHHLSAEPFFVFNGDVLTDLDLGAMLAFHRASSAKVTISLTPVDDPTAYGLVETAADGRVGQFVEKPTWDRVTTNMINGGTYILDPEVLGDIPAGHYMFERGLFPSLLDRGEPVFGYPSNAYWLDIGTPQKYLQAHLDALNGRVNTTIPGRVIADGIRMGEDCVVSPRANLVAPVVLGDGVRIGDEAVVLGPVAIHDGCRVGTKAMLERAVVRERTALADHATIKDSLVGVGCEIGEGAIVAGGAVVADGCVIGAGNRLDHGIKIWPGNRLEANAISF